MEILKVSKTQKNKNGRVKEEETDGRRARSGQKKEESKFPTSSLPLTLRLPN